MTLLGRRGLIAGMAALLAAPVIVRATSLMPLSVQRPEFHHLLLGLNLTWDDAGLHIAQGARINHCSFVDLMMTPVRGGWRLDRFRQSSAFLTALPDDRLTLTNSMIYCSGALDLPGGKFA